MLHLAAENGHAAVVELLIEKGAWVDVRNGCDVTPLHMAAEKGYEAIINLLIEKGKAAVDVKSIFFHFTPLHLAAENGHKSVAKLLIEKGRAVVDAESNEKMTPLHLAVLKNHLEMVEYLVEQGADIKHKDKNQMTPLDMAKDLQYLPRYRTLGPFLRLAAEKLAAEKSQGDKSSNEFARTPSDVGIFQQFISFFTTQKSDDEPQDQSHSTQQPHYSRGKN